jgi:capsular polysaccharide transport system permease protein
MMMKLASLTRALTLLRGEHLRRALIFVRSDHQVPASRSADTAIIGIGTRIVPTVYDTLRTRRRRRRLMIGLTIGLPTCLAAAYYTLIASNRYVSDAQMVVSDAHSAGPPNSPSSASGGASGGASSLLSLSGLAGAAGMPINEYMMVYSYFTSIEAMEALDQRIGLRRMWSAGSIDFLSRLSRDAPQRDFYRYYTNHITVIADPTNPVMELQAQAFSQTDAQLIARTLVQLAQEKLNEAYLIMEKDALGFARSEVDKAQQKLKDINGQLRDFRNAHGEFDVTGNAGGVGAIALGLFSQLASTEADLKTTLSYAREDSPLVESLKARITALKKQFEVDRQLLAGQGTDGKAYADLMSTYGDLLLDQQFAQGAYTSALAFLTTSRTNLEQHHTFLVDFLAPNLPGDATLPRSWLDLLLVALASALVAVIGSLILAALREHAHL